VCSSTLSQAGIEGQEARERGQDPKREFLTFDSCASLPQLSLVTMLCVVTSLHFLNTHSFQSPVFIISPSFPLVIPRQFHFSSPEKALSAIVVAILTQIQTIRIARSVRAERLWC
jgi:hypothetical protein